MSQRLDDIHISSLWRAEDEAGPICAILADAGWEARAACLAAGLSPSEARLIEAGHRRISLHTRCALAAAVGMRPADLKRYRAGEPWARRALAQTLCDTGAFRLVEGDVEPANREAAAFCELASVAGTSRARALVPRGVYEAAARSFNPVLPADVAARFVSSARASAGLTMRGFGAALGSTRHAVGAWESGTRTPTTRQVETMCELFGLRLDDALRFEVLDFDEAATAYLQLTGRERTARQVRSWASAERLVQECLHGKAA